MRLAPTANSAINDNLIHAAPVTLSRVFDLSRLIIDGVFWQWPPKQRTGACAPNITSRLGIISPTPIPAP